MHKQRYYIDTSVFGGYFDIEFEKWSKIFINDILQGIHIPVLSDVTIREIEKAPMRVNELFESILKCDIELIEVNEEIEILSNIYIHQKAISEKFKEDALHIACASIYKVDALISWNFKHIVNVDRIRKYNSVNLFNNYNLLDIRTPMEVLNGNEEI